MKEKVLDHSVDFVCADIPYGTTECAWDIVIPFDEMWEQIKRVSTKTAPTVLFATQPFTSNLICSNIDEYRYSWVWDKTFGRGHLVAKYRPMQQTEDICVFGGGQYYPIMSLRDHPILSKECGRTNIMGGVQDCGYEGKLLYDKHPTNVLTFKPVPSVSNLHPTQKPVPLLKYLINTYTVEGMTILDFTMGSGSTGSACISLGRNFIGIDNDPKFFEISEKRLWHVSASGQEMSKNNASAENIAAPMRLF